MRYAEILSKAISDSGLTLKQIAIEVGNLTGSEISIHYLSRLQNGKTPPASDKLNGILADILGMDSLTLKANAYREKIPGEILEKIK